MKRIIAVVPLLLLACKGPKGDPGTAGMPGAAAPTAGTFIYSGSIDSDNLLVKNLGSFDASKGDVASVDVCTAPSSSSFCGQLGTVQVSTAPYYLAFPSAINILNAKTAGYANYAITIMQPSGRSN